MQTFRDTLDAYLNNLEGGEIAFAAALNCTQAAVNRYRNGKRFPDATTARLIAEKSGGKVPFELWRDEFMTRSGLAA